MHQIQSSAQNSLQPAKSISRSLRLSKGAPSSAPRERYFTIKIACLFLAIFAFPVTAAFAAMATLAWDPSSGPVAGYKVYYGKSSQNYIYSVNVGNTTTCTISGLQEGTTYYFATTARDTYNSETGYSEEVVIKIPEGGRSGIRISETMEIGEAYVDDNWKRVNFSKSFANPIVVANPLSLNGADPAVVRIRNVSNTGFDIRVQEWDYLDGVHAFEYISYLVAERGRFTLENGVSVEADRFSTNKVKTFDRFSFKQSFGNVPVVITSVTSINGEAAVTGRVQSVTNQSFEYTMQEQELFSDGHSTESIDYIAWGPSTGQIGGHAYKVARPTNTVNHELQPIEFFKNFSIPPLFLADMQTANGIDTANLRLDDIDTSGVILQIDEETSMDSEIEHGDETIGYVAISSFPTMETGEVQVDSKWKRVNFSKPFTDPIVVANPLSLNGADPAVVRLRNVNTTGFDIRVQEWNYLDDSHGLENLSYLVMERGSFMLENGARVEAGRFNTDKTNSFISIGFDQVFSNAPVIITSITSMNGSDTVTGRVRNVTIQNFDYTMQEQELGDQIHAIESIAYIAWEPSKGNISGRSYEVVRTGNIVDHNLYTIQFLKNFANQPIFLADLQTSNGVDPANIRWKNKSTNSITLQVDEEESKDTEIDHATEMIGYIVFSQ